MEGLHPDQEPSVHLQTHMKPAKSTEAPSQDWSEWDGGVSKDWQGTRISV